VVIGAHIGSQLTIRIGPRVVVPAGLELAMTGMFWLSKPNLETAYSARSCRRSC
jgi:hypothetical protein